VTIPRDQGFRGIFIFRPSSKSRCAGEVLCLPFSMKLFWKAAFSTLSVGFGLFSCVQHDIPLQVDCLSDTEISYVEDVDPIVIQNCAISGCHNGDNGTHLDWTDFDNFQSHSAEVRRRVTLPSDHPDHMPKSGSLTVVEIQTIICWVDQGALNN
jgi:hypothetical protein